jgi:hypothetical protein
MDFMIVVLEQKVPVHEMLKQYRIGVF